jgi:cyclomaltodextrinase
MGRGKIMSVPQWVKDSIFYQIFPDRFNNGSTANDPPNVVPWLSVPTNHGFHGGDLRGIIDRMYYLIDLGVNAIYFNPIFLSPSNHRYNTVDYYQVDPKLGSKFELLTLLDVAHRNNIRLILDGVFNHCGRGFFAFNDILENQNNSAYVDWYHVQRFPVDAYSSGDATTYTGWWKYKSLPKFNTFNPTVKKYIIEVARYWIEQGFDGWRLDVPNEIDDDLFWSDFRRVIKNTNPEAYLLGEIWDGNPRWVGSDHFDGLMNYPLRTLLVDLLMQKTPVEAFTTAVSGWLTKYPLENVFSLYNLLGSHDTERILTVLKGDVSKAKLAYLFLLTYPGAPGIYYGDEIGLTGGSDPECRRAFPWEESSWNATLRQWIRELIWTRKESIALRQGKMLFLTTSKNCLAYARVEQQDFVIIVMNISDQALNAEVDVTPIDIIDGLILRNVLNPDIVKVDKNKILLNLPAWSGANLVPN